MPPKQDRRSSNPTPADYDAMPSGSSTPTHSSVPNEVEGTLTPKAEDQYPRARGPPESEAPPFPPGKFISKDPIEDIESQLDLSGEQLEALRGDLEKFKGVSESYSRETAELSRMMERQKGEFDRITNDLDRRRKEVEKLRSLLQSVRQTTATKGSVYDKQLETLKKKLAKQESKLQSSEELHREAEKQLRRRREQLEERQLEAENLHASLERLLWSIKQQEQDKERNAKKLEELRRECEQVKRDASRAREQAETASREEMERLRRSADEEVGRERARADALEAELQSLQQQPTTDEEERAAGAHPREATSRRLPAEKADAVVVVEKGKALEKEAARGGREDPLLHVEEIESLRAEAALHQVECCKLQTEVDRAARHGEALRHEVERARTDLRDLPARAQRGLEEQRRLLDFCDEDRQQAMAQFNSLKSQVTRVEANLTSLQYDLASREAALKREKDTCCRLLAETEATACELRNVRACAERCRAERDMAGDRTERLRAEVDHIRGEFAAYKETALGPEEASFLRKQLDQVRIQQAEELEAERERRRTAERHYHTLKTKVECEYRSALGKEHDKVRSLQSRIASRESSDSSTRIRNCC